MQVASWVVAMAVTLGAWPFESIAAEYAELRKILMQRMPGVRIGEIRTTPVDGLVEVVANGLNVFYSSASGDHVIIGEMIESASKRNLGRERAEALHTIDFASLPLDKAIVKVKGSGARKLALFSDPDCPFCKQLERELSAITDVTIYTFLLPIPSLHPDARRKAEQVWCAPDRARAWDDLMLSGREPAAGTSCDTPLSEIAQLADRLNIAGTPGIVFGNGRLVPGAISRLEIEKHLNVPPLRATRQ